MSIKGGKIGELYIIGCGICFHWSGWLDQRFLSGGGPSDTLHLILCSAAPLAWFSGLLTLTAATSASLHNRFLLSFYTTSFLSRLTAKLPAFNWQGIDYQTARVTLVSYTGGDEEQPCCTVSPRPAAHQSLTDSTVRCNIALCLHQKWLVFCSPHILYCTCWLMWRRTRYVPFSAFCSLLFQVYWCRHHRDGGRDVRCLLRRRLHRQSPGSRLFDPLWPQLSQ